MKRNSMTLAEWKKLRKKPSKYRNKPVVVDGQRFDSKAEANQYRELFAYTTAKDPAIKLLLRQVPFPLPGKTTYRADFLIVWDTGVIQVREVKGVWTQAAKIKWRQVKELYPNVSFVEVTA